jgi:hypothetical protein
MVNKSIKSVGNKFKDDFRELVSLDVGSVNIDLEWDVKGFWLERTYLINGVNITEFSWPIDRIAVLSLAPVNADKPYSSTTKVQIQFNDILNPEIQDKGETIEEHIVQQLEAWRTRMKVDPYIHLFRISGFNDFFAIYLSANRCYPIEDFHSKLRHTWQENV